MFQLVFGRKWNRVLSPKDESDQLDFHQRQVQKQTSVLVLRCIIANGMGTLHYCEGTIDMEAYIWMVQRYKLPSR